MEEINWNLASNSQLKEESERLAKNFEEKKQQVGNLISQLETLDKEMNELSKQYMSIKKIINKREGKNDDT